MRTVMFSTKSYDRYTFTDRNDFHGYGHELVFQEARLTIETAPLADGFPAICGFVNDILMPSLSKNWRPKVYGWSHCDQPGSTMLTCGQPVDAASPYAVFQPTHRNPLPNSP